MRLTCYPQPGKAKAQRVCEAFAAGMRAAGGDADVCTAIPAKLKPGIPVFYGVRPAWAHLWAQAKAEGRDWLYLDNSYFDADRERCFRATKNAVQWSGSPLIGIGEAKFRGRIEPWSGAGDHIVICPQSAEYMELVAGWEGDWLAQVTGQLRQLTKRPFRLRKKGDRRPLSVDLDNAWALVTHTSAAAVEAALAGVPVFVTGTCAASGVAMNRGLYSFARIEERPDGHDIRAAWAEQLARLQWSLDEIRQGIAWRALNA